MSSASFTLRPWTLLSIAVVVPLGFGLKLYVGPGEAWVNNSLAGVAYEIFWCLAVFAVWPRPTAITRIATGVFVATPALEALQLWHPSWLEAIRSTFAGRALIGTTFVWSDLAYYVIGCVIGWLWLHGIVRAAADVPPRGARDQDLMPDEVNTQSWPIACHRCGAELTPGEGSFYVVRIEAFADPTPPPLDQERSLAEIRSEMTQLIESMGDLSAQEMMDQVYRRMTVLLCTGCYKGWIDNPTG